MVKEPSRVLYQTRPEQDIPVVVYFLERTAPSTDPSSIYPIPVTPLPPQIGVLDLIYEQDPVTQDTN